MKQLKTPTLGIFLAAGLVAANPMSRVEMLEHAFQHSEQLEQIHQERIRVHSMEKEYRAKALPEIDGSFHYLYKPKSYNPFSFGPFPSVSEMMDENAPGFENDQILAGTFDHLFSNLDLTPKKQTLKWEISAIQPIFAQGKIITAVQIASLASDMIDLQEENIRQNLAEQVSESYFLALMAEDNIKIRENALYLAKESHNLAVRRFDVGRGNQLDTLNTRYVVQNEEYQLREAQKNRRLAVQKLLTTISSDRNPDHVVLSDSLIPEFNLPDFEVARSEMIKNNSLISVLRKGEEMQSRQTDLTRADYRPTVFAGASIGQISQFDKPTDSDFGWDIKLFTGVQVPIWHGGQRTQRMVQARAEEMKFRSRVEETENLLTLALTAAYEEFQLAEKNLLQAKEMQNLAQRGAAIAERAYEVGHITQLELNQNRQNQNLSNLAYTHALYQLNSAAIKIKRLIGSPQLLTSL